MGPDRVRLFLNVWQLELGSGSVLFNFPLLGWGLKGSKEAFLSHRNAYLVPPVQFTRVLFLLLSSKESLKPLPSGTVRMLEEVLPFPQDDLSSIPRIACGTWSTLTFIGS